MARYQLNIAPAVSVIENIIANDSDYSFTRTDLYKDNGDYIYNRTFLIDILKAYIAVSRSNGSRYYRYDNGERSRIWATPYFLKIRDDAGMSAYKSRMLTSGVGYKYRDVIWIVLAILKAQADKFTSGNSFYRPVYELWNIADRRNDELTIVNNENDESGLVQLDRQNESQSQSSVENPENVIPTNSTIPASVPTPAGRVGTGVLLLAGAAIIGIFMIMKKRK